MQPSSIPAACALAFALVGLAHASPVAAQESTADSDRIRATVEKFHQSLAEGDSTRALSFLHPDVVIYESGHAETLAEYRSGHLAADIEFARSVTATPEDEAIEMTPSLAVYLRETRYAGSFQGHEVDAHGTETIALVPTDRGWKILHIHWSSR